MKKNLCILFIALMALSVVFAQDADTNAPEVKATGADASPGGAGDDKGMHEETPVEAADGSDGQMGHAGSVAQKNKGSENSMQVRVKEGSFDLPQGKTLRMQEMKNERVQLRVNDHSAETAMEMVQERQQNRTKLYAKLSNGKNAEIKVMPDMASERAIERLRLNVCSQENNCTIELKETGSGNQTQAAYEVKARKQARILGLFPAEMPVEAQVSAESGELIRSNRPWWAFLASE